ncbi:MAG: hypothetical protein IMZ61_16485, partial [Planctomycetes bacterium]|nr:hypothetical protein [Planctomycetota bacterium]
DGILIIQARRYRTQEQNRFDATQRLTNLIQKALVKPKIRRPTHPGVTAKAARLGEKKQRGETKRTRRYNAAEWED